VLIKNTHLCSATCVLRRRLQSEVSSSLWPQSTASIQVSTPIGYVTVANASVTMTHRFVKISGGSEGLEIRRYEDTDERINLDRIQEYWVGGTN
jgi:hypothetical protein